MHTNLGAVHDESMVSVPAAILSAYITFFLLHALSLTLVFSAFVLFISLMGTVDDLLLRQRLVKAGQGFFARKRHA